METFYSVAGFCGTKLICCLHVSKKAEQPVHSGTNRTFKIKLSVETDLGSKTNLPRFLPRVGRNLPLRSAVYKLSAYGEFQTQKGLNLQVSLHLYRKPFLFKAKFLKIGRGEQLPGPLLFSPLLMLLNLCYYSLWSFSILFPLNTSSQHFPLPCISKAKFIVFP